MQERQKPIELILARNLVSSLTTPAFLVDEDAVLVFYNEPAGALLGRRFEETGAMTPEQWSAAFGPLGPEDHPIPLAEVPLTLALRRGRPAHGRFRIRSLEGESHTIEASALPIVATEGTRGAMVFFWPAEDGT